MALAVLVCAAMMVACSGEAKKISKGNTKKMDTLSYCIGANIGTGVRMQFADFNLNIEQLKSGIEGGLTKKANISADDAVSTLRTFFSETMQLRQTDYQALREHDSTAVFVPFENEEENENISYALGVDIGNNLLQSPYTIQYFWLLQGIQDAANEDVKLTDEAMQEFMQHYHVVVLPQQAAERSAKWIEKMSKKSGVKTTESGLCYKVVEAGDMEKAAKNDADVVKVHYVGKLQDGTVFDASRFADKFTAEQIAQFREQYPDMFDENGNFKQADEPIEFPLNGVIKGWTEGMKLVGPGGKIILYIPADLAYGARGAGRQIGPNEALEFTVELLEVTPAPTEEAAAAEETPAK